MSNLNFWLRDSFSYFSNIKNYFEFRYLLNPNLFFNSFTGPYFRRKIVNNLDALVMEYHPLIKTAKNNYNYKKNVFALPHRPFERQYVNVNHQSEQIVFVVPGTINKVRRNYELVLNTFETLFQKYNDKIKLILLGRPIQNYSEEIVKKCEELILKNCNLHYYKEAVSVEEFDIQLKNCDFVISPLNLIIEKEIYSWTKGTGVFADALKYGKVTFVPEGYNTCEELPHSVILFSDSNSLYNEIEKYILQPNLINDLNSIAVKEMEVFSLENSQKMFDDIIKIVLNTNS